MSKSFPIPEPYSPEANQRDQVTGAEVDRYEGYFAGQDARRRAVSENERHNSFETLQEG